jgi:hypothetical protein
MADSILILKIYFFLLNFIIKFIAYNNALIYKQNI